MQTAPHHLDTPELEQRLPHVEASPHDEGRLEVIVVRPVTNGRRVETTAQLTPEGGIEGDRWATEPASRKQDAAPDRRNQISLMNARILRLIAGHEDAVCLAGDNLIVDLDLSEENLPAGSRLQVGNAVIELSDLPHTGCGKFSRRYGDQARAFVNNPRGKQLHLRGRYGWVVTGDTIHVGDTVRKLPN